MLSVRGRKPKETTPEERFYGNIYFSEDGCWIWCGDYNAKSLPLFHARYKGKCISMSARKFAWETTNGKVPQGREVEFICGNGKCVNPDHLELNTAENSFWSFVKKTGDRECWEWTGGLDSMGYGSFRGMKAHRFSYKINFEDFDNNLDVLHTCDNRSCVNPNHLFQGTHLDNMKDMVSKGRSKRGEKSGKHKLTELQAKEIKLRIESGERDFLIAKDYGVSSGAIRNIRIGRCWFWL